MSWPRPSIARCKMVQADTSTSHNLQPLIGNLQCLARFWRFGSYALQTVRFSAATLPARLLQFGREERLRG